MSIADIAIAYDKGEITRDQMRWCLMSQESRDHATKQFETEVSPQQIATIFINDLDPVLQRYKIEYGDIASWTIRECINRYVDETISKAGMIILFEHYAERVTTAKSMTIEELAEDLSK